MIMEDERSHLIERAAARLSASNPVLLVDQPAKIAQPAKTAVPSLGLGSPTVEAPLPHATNNESFGFEGRADLGYLVALDFDDPILHRSAGATGCAQLFCHFFDDGDGKMSCKIVDDDNGLSTSMGSLASEQNPTHLPDRFIRDWRRGAGVF